MGTGDQAGRVYIIDFGLSNMWRDSAGSHIKYNTDSAFRGTHRYASINSHFKSEQSRRDDLEALGYVLIYFASGGLPWQNVKVARHKRRKSIGKCKQSVPIEELTRNLPVEFAKYMTYVRSLQFEEKPNYDALRNLFSGCFRRLQLVNDRVFDWMHTPVSPTGAIVIDPPSEIALYARPDVIEISSDKDDAPATQIMKAPVSPVAYLNTPSYRNRANMSSSMAVPSTPGSGSDLTASALFSPTMASIFGRPASSQYIMPLAASRSNALADEDAMQLSTGSDGIMNRHLPTQVESPLGLSTTSIASNNLFGIQTIPTSMSPNHQSSHSPVSPPLPEDIMLQDEIEVQDEDIVETPPVEEDDSDAPARSRKRKRDSSNSVALQKPADDEDLSAPKRRSLRLQQKQRNNSPLPVEAN